MLAIVARASFISRRLAPSTATPIGTPRPSVSNDRLPPAFPQSVGLGPVFVPSQRCRGHRLVHHQPVPITALQFIEQFDADLPAFQEYASGDPLPKAIIRRGCGAPVCRVQRRPLTTGTEHIKDGVGAAAIRTRGNDRRQTDGRSWSTTAGAAPARPTGRPRCERRLWSCCLVCAHACAWVLVQCSYDKLTVRLFFGALNEIESPLATKKRLGFKDYPPLEATRFREV